MHRIFSLIILIFIHTLKITSKSLWLPLLTDGDVWVFCNIYLKFIPHKYLEDLEWFEAIFKIFVHAVFEAIVVKGWSRLNFEAATSKFCNNFWKFGCQPRKSKADLCMTNGSKVLIYLTLISFFLALLTRVSLWGTIKKTNK